MQFIKSPPRLIRSGARKHTIPKEPGINPRIHLRPAQFEPILRPSRALIWAIAMPHTGQNQKHGTRTKHFLAITPFDHAATGANRNQLQGGKGAPTPPRKLIIARMIRQGVFRASRNLPMSHGGNMKAPGGLLLARREIAKIVFDRFLQFFERKLEVLNLSFKKNTHRLSADTTLHEIRTTPAAHRSFWHWT